MLGRVVVRTNEAFYGSPPNFSLTRSPVSKPTPGRVSCNTVPLRHPPRRRRSIGLCTQENIWMIWFQLFSSLRRAGMKRSLVREKKKIAGFGGGL